MKNNKYFTRAIIIVALLFIIGGITMSLNETIVHGKYYRICTDKIQKLWDRISFWTDSRDVTFQDGLTAEQKIGGLDGISDNYSTNSSRIALSTKGAKTINDSLSSTISSNYSTLDTKIDNNYTTLDNKITESHTTVIHSLNSISTTDALSAAMGKYLADTNLLSRKFYTEATQGQGANPSTFSQTFVFDPELEDVYWPCLYLLEIEYVDGGGSANTRYEITITDNTTNSITYRSELDFYEPEFTYEDGEYTVSGIHHSPSHTIKSIIIPGNQFWTNNLLTLKVTDISSPIQGTSAAATHSAFNVGLYEAWFSKYYGGSN